MMLTLNDMMLTLIFVVIAAANAICFLFIGYLAGRHSERAAWNQLIQQGVIPKPKEDDCHAVPSRPSRFWKSRTTERNLSVIGTIPEE